MAAFETSRNHINWTMGSILAIYPTYSSQERTKAILFCHWDLSQHEKSMPPSLNWDGLPIQRHFQNGRQRSEIHVFAYYSASRIDRDQILVSKPMFFWMKNPMMTLNNPYDSWLTLG